MFFIHRVANAVTMMYNEADELTVCHFIRPKERAKILEGLADQSDQAEADDVQQSSEQAPEQREVLVMGEGRVLATSPSPVSVGGGVVQPSSPAQDAQRALSPIESSPAALDERGSPSRPADALKHTTDGNLGGYSCLLQGQNKENFGWYLPRSREVAKWTNHRHPLPFPAAAAAVHEVGFTFEEYEREAENVLKGIFTTAERIINGEEGSFGEGLDEALLPVVKEIEAL
ncbi:hypothetical protein FOZ63_008975 [Perkinsus olseni]|uniref:Uncharacterized protein n=1 Tax=Perkinsus olseni TaxID=32597 RepID=A0A7J6U362_PEROL|nr:hypothetical protein FOZ63_008975 [Perkinsus olseni]KAF4751257.1 hypothetical protein FOZ62_007504 [Perkinsus olseni]